MGFGEFLIICIVVVALAALAIWILGQLGAPPLIVKIVWFVAGFIILMTLAGAVGLFGHDIQIPRIR